MKTLLKQAALMAAGIVALLPGLTRAQVFNNATQTEYQYPGFGIVTTTTHSFTYTMSHIGGMTSAITPPPGPGPYSPYFGGVPLSDLTVHTWDDAGVQGGIAYLNTASPSSTPSPTIYDQGFIIYPNAQGIEVSLQQDEMGYAMFTQGTNAAWYVIVSYWTPLGASGTPGHFVDVYLWNQPVPNSTGGLTLVSTTQLSTIPFYTRISQDGHNTYGFSITWEDPSNGIDFVYGFMNSSIHGPSISPVYTLPGTAGETHPDVAFTHSGPLNLQFLYYHLAGGLITITESTIPMVLGPVWPAGAPAPTVNDVNILPYRCSAHLPDLKTRLDAPDHYGTDDWAYTYIYQPLCGLINDEIYVRYDNAGTRTTYCVTNGTIPGLAACDVDPFTHRPYLNDWPVCSFDATTTQLNVNWYTQYQNSGSIPTAFFLPDIGGYVGMKMNNNGTLASLADFLQVGENATGSNTLASHTPTIASSRQNDRTDYQFVAFANIPNMSPVMMIKDRVWTSPTFKGGHATNYWAGLYSPTATPNTVKTVNSVAAYPNPFADKISLDISAGLMDKTLNISVEDEAGRVLDKFTAQGNAVNTRLATTSGKLNDGIYFVKVQSPADDFNQVIKIQKLAAH